MRDEYEQSTTPPPPPPLFQILPPKAIYLNRVSNGGNTLLQVFLRKVYDPDRHSQI